MASRVDDVEIVIVVLSSIAGLCNGLSVVFKLCQDYSNPKLWKYSFLFTNIAHVFLVAGLVLFCVNLVASSRIVCATSGVFLLFGVFECLFSLLTSGIILLAIQHPGKSTKLPGFHRNLVLLIVIPEVILGAGLSVIPYTSDSLFDKSNTSGIQCFPIRSLDDQGSLYGLGVVILWWLIIIATIVIHVILVLKLWKFNNRINSAHYNVWQAQLVSLGKTHVKFLISALVVHVCVLVILTFCVYSKSSGITTNSTWIIITSMAIAAVLNGVLSNVSDVMWSSCCCRGGSAVEEPHRKLKKLELLKIEGAGKLRMKATWSIGKHATKRGLMKVYGLNYLKAWAQEIVILGMLRRAQHPSLLQCLWTNSSNPYYETMTLISGEIITSDSRIICLELTNGGTLQTFLQKAELPLPEPCQRMIIHDIAEGLFYLHHENVLHSNLNSSCIYLKGSLQSMVLRAAVGDFENGQIYGSLQQNMDESIKDKRYFFLPDIRSFALIALEVLSKMCERKFQNRYVNYNSEQVPLKLNLEHVISDEEDEFEAQYCYDAEDTHRMFDSLHEDQYLAERCLSPTPFESPMRSNSLENLLDRSRPLSPNMPRQGSKTPETVSESDMDDEVAKYSTPEVQVSTSNSAYDKTDCKPERCKSPDSKKTERRIIAKRKSRKDVSKSADRAMTPIVTKTPHSRSLSPSQYNKALENGRCVSPDPMNDEMLQELRKVTKESNKAFKKDRKFSFSRKKSEEKITVPQKVEAFVNSADETKKKDGKWLSKPTSILKSITSNDTAVSVFKAKPTEENNYLDAIEEEDTAATSQTVPNSKSKSKQKKDKIKLNEVWDIIDEQYYSQVNKKANRMLKKTVSGESRSSLWSFISTPEDVEDEDLDDVLDCLPGMTDPAELRKSEVTVNDIMAATQNGKQREEERKRFSFKDLPHSKFELIDYYELLKAKQITIYDVPEDKREMLINVVELKREEKLRKEGKLLNGGAIANDAMYDNGMNPGSLNINDANNNEKPQGGKIKIVSFRQANSHSSPHRPPVAQQEPDPRLERARSAPLKRPRTPMHKPMTTEKPTPEINPIFIENRSPSVAGIAKRNKARTALKRALNNKGQNTGATFDANRGLNQSRDLTVKYATVKKINVSSVSQNEGGESNENGQVLVVPIPTSESFSVTKVNPPKSLDIKRYHSFSSNESGSSIASSVREKKADVSLTSGELSSLSSQAESDHYETDGHMTDIEGPSKPINSDRTKQGKRPSSKVDSGFDSGSMSSEMSSGSVYNRGQNFVHTQGNSNRVIGSWARNYKVVEPISNSPAYFGSKFLPHESLPEEQYPSAGSESQRNPVNDRENARDQNDNDSGIIITNKKRNSKGGNKTNRNTAYPISQKTFENTDTSFAISPDSKYSSTTLRPMSPSSRVTPPLPQNVNSKSMSPNVRSAGTPMSKTIQQTNRPMSPGARSTNRPMSPQARTMSPVTGQPMSVNRPMSPLSRPMSPNVQPTEHRATARSQNASRPMSPLAKPNMSSRPTSLSPNRDGHRALSSVNRRSKSSDNSQNGKRKSKESRTGIGGTGESAAEIASKRYRELVKQGVPLRATAVDGKTIENEEKIAKTPEILVRPGTADSTLEEPVDDQTLFADLESKGFFNTRSRSPSPHKGASPKRLPSPKAGGMKDVKQRESRSKRNKKLPLDQIIRENPESKSSGRKPFRSSSNQHLTVSEDAFLNQPTSEDSETCSIKTNKSNSSTPSGSKPKVMVDAEMVIDRIFSQNNPADYELDVEVEAALGLDKDPFKSLPEMYGNFKDKERVPNLDNIPLLNGVDDRHIHGCMELASSLHVVTVRDLLPATADNFDVLRNKLQQVGQLGTVGNQLLDIISKCWLQDMPPTSGDLVEQLTDPVTETEV